MRALFRKRQNKFIELIHDQAALTLGYNFYADYLAFITYSNYFLFLERT